MTPPRMIAYSQSKFVMNKAEVFVKQEDTKNNTQKSAKTENEIRTKFEELFQKYGIEYSIEKLLILIGDSITREQLLDSDDSKLDRYLINIEHAFNITNKSFENNLKETVTLMKIYNSTGWKNFDVFDSEVKNEKNLDAKCALQKQCKNNNISSADFKNLSKDEKKQYIKEYFEENYAKYLEAANNDPQLAKKMLFGVMLAKTSDKDKKLLLPIINEVINDSKILKTFFDSFDDVEIAKECANTLTYDEWKNLPNEEMKVAYIQNMTKKGIDVVQEGYKQDVVDFYKKHGKELVELEAKSKYSKLEPEEQALIDRRNTLTNSGAVMAAAALGNNNISDDEKKECASEVTQIAQKYGFEDEYLADFANIIKNGNFDLQISKDEIKEFVDSLTNGKFSEKYNTIPEKSATDEKTGGFKTNPDAAAIASLKKDEQQTTILNNNPIENNTFVIETTETYIEDNTEENGLKAESFLEKYGQNFAFKLFTGKIKTFSSLEESLAINNYKRMDVAQQGKLLQTSIGKFFNKLIDNTKTYTLENLLACGWKGQTFNITQQVEDTVEERNKKLKSLPS